MQHQNKKTIQHLFDALNANDRISQDSILSIQQEYIRTKENKAPVMIQLLSFVGALFGGIFFIGFLQLFNLLEIDAVRIFFGLIATLFALYIPYSMQQKTSFEPIAMALLIIGSILFISGFDSGYKFIEYIYLLLIVAVVVVLSAASQLQKITAIFTINACLYLIIWDHQYFYFYGIVVLLNAIVLTACCLKETTLLAHTPKFVKWYPAILNGCSVSMIGMLVLTVNLYSGHERFIGGDYWWLVSLVLTALLLWVMKHTLELLKQNHLRLPVLLLTGLSMLLLIKAPAIIAGLLLLLVGLYAGYYLLVGQAIIAIFIGTCQFYYNLDTTLLVKSIYMIIAGLLFLTIGFWFKKLSQKELNN